ncbi:MAG TPA: YcgN family cysteine cluster protein [Gammaproteobacteria bacterium]|nr:YcgN family cysteine cluster protein [Gammaproteobacteria bacterium]
MTRRRARSTRSSKPFWETKSLREMTQQEWESLCDGCGRCCLHKYEYEDTGRVHYTDVACKLLDLKTCRCRHYERRLDHVPDCVVLSKDRPEDLDWMPSTCAYRRLAEGRGLADWHPLVSGRADSVVRAGISVRGRVVSERRIPAADIEDRLISWLRAPVPKAKRRKRS